MVTTWKPIAALGLLATGAGALVSQATQSQGVTRQTAFEANLPNLPGQRISGFLVTYAPGAGSRPHHHTARGSVMVYVLEGEVRSQVNDGPVTIYRAGESWQEPPGAAHRVAENASASKPARLLAIFVADSGAVLTTVDSLP
jgi:quercetin dioxygenase-like cupin family protein